jgi:hypothetical protein
MTGREAPSSISLEQNLAKRVLAVEGNEDLGRRFNRIGVPRRERREELLEKRFNRFGIPPSPKADSASLISLKGKKTAPQPPPVAVANDPTANDSLGLDIE